VETTSRPAEVGRQSSGESTTPVYVVWYKWSDLRIDDHEPLRWAHAQALANSGKVLHIHMLEEIFFGKSLVGALPRCGDLRARFWLESVEDLANSLAKMDSSLLVLPARTAASCFQEVVIPALAQSGFRLEAVTTHREVCEEELRTEAAVRRVLQGAGARFELFWGGLTVHHIDDLGFDPSNRREMPQLYQPFLKAVKGQRLRKPYPPPQDVAGALPLTLDQQQKTLSAAFASAGAKVHEGDLDQRARASWTGGEAQATERLAAYAWKEDRLRRYVGASDSMHPGSDNAINSTTRLSPWLAFGCISPRRVMAEVQRYEKQRCKNRSTYWVYHELVFRDFFRFSCLTWGSSLFKLGGPFKVTGLEWSRDLRLLDRWIQGRTGFPFVDAGMRELAATGYMSHLHRQCCASFLIRDLRLDWRLGAEYFESVLVDYTPDANWGNWAYRTLPRPQLVKRGCPCKRHLSTLEILSWPCVHDPELEHTLLWVPELRSLAADLAREPWRRRGKLGERVWVMPEKDSPLWFTAVNRVNWPEYQAMMSGWAWTVTFDSLPKAASGQPVDGANPDGAEYPDPIVPPLCLEIDLSKIPVDHSWGDTPQEKRPHVAGSSQPQGDIKWARASKGKGKAKGKGKTWRHDWKSEGEWSSDAYAHGMHAGA